MNKKIKVIGTAFALVVMLTGCASEGHTKSTQKEEPVETPVETPVEERVYKEDYVIPELDLTFTSESLENLNEADKEKVEKLVKEVTMVGMLNAKDKKHSTKITWEKIRHLFAEEVITIIDERMAGEDVEESTDKDSGEEWWFEVTERGTYLARSRDEVKNPEILYVDVYENYLEYGVGADVLAKEYTSKDYKEEDEEAAKVVGTAKDGYVIEIVVENGEFRMYGSGVASAGAMKYLDERQLIDYDFAKVGELRKPKYSSEKNVFAVGGEYWGTSKEEWIENSVDSDLHAMYFNAADETFSYIFEIYNNTDAVVSDRYGLMLQRLSYDYKENGEEAREYYTLSQSASNSIIIDLELQPGESVLHEVVMKDKEWAKTLNRRINEGAIVTYYTDLDVQKIKE